MKKINFALVICLTALVSFNANAINLDDLIKKDENGQIAISTDSLGENFEKSITEKLDKEIEKVTKDIDGKVEELKVKADNEIAKVTKIIDEAQKEFELIKRIKAKIKGYVVMAYFAVGALGALLIILILILIKLWLKVSKFGKISSAFKVIKDIDKRIKVLENKVAKL